MPPNTSTSAEKMIKLRDLSRSNTEKDKLVLSILGKTYDITKWVDQHPGGAIIRQYNGLDATHVFQALHGEQGHKTLAAMTPISESTLVDSKLDDATLKENEILLSKFDALKQELINDGFWKRSIPWHVYKIVTTMLMLPISVWLIGQEQYFLSSLVAGVMWQQLGWLGHDWSHHNASDNRDMNNIVGWFFGNVMQGYSGAWWKDRHNSHHAVTNIVEHDPDIDNIPMLAWHESDIDKCPEWARSTLQYQAYYFLFILPVLRLTWCLQSLFFADAMKTSNFAPYRASYKMEMGGLVFHWLWVLVLLAQMPFWSAVSWFIVAENLSGFGIAIVVFFNHYSCEKFDGKLASNFVKLQLMTTRNMSPGVVTDWVCGGLNYQIEHHLFPTMPRHNLAKASFRIMKFCKENNLPYMCCGFNEGLGYVLGYLNDIGAIAKKRSEKSK